MGHLHAHCANTRQAPQSDVGPTGVVVVCAPLVTGPRHFLREGLCPSLPEATGTVFRSFESPRRVSGRVPIFSFALGITMTTDFFVPTDWYRNFFTAPVMRFWAVAVPSA